MRCDLGFKKKIIHFCLHTPVAALGIFLRVFLKKHKYNNNNKKTSKYIKFTISFYEFSYFEIVAW